MQKVSYMGNGSTTEFNFNFPYFENTDIVVTMNNQAATGYNIIGTSAGADADIPYTGGKVVFETAPTALDSIVIARSLPLARQYDYQPTAKIDPTTLNQDMNYLMEVVKDLKDELGTLSAQYSDIADKESTAVLLARINAVNEQIHDFETEIENGRIMSRDDFYSYATNCVIESPQNIKLELNNGTLTLKAGSKIYVPNGNGVFNMATIAADKTITNSSNDTYIVCVKSDGSGMETARLSTQVASGTTTPTSSWWIYYNTSDNKVYRVENGVVARNISLPIAIIKVTNGAISSIEQTFNGIGYIGSVAFVLPGVSALIPNGRNTDGTLKNIRYTTTTVSLGERNLTGQSIPLWLRNDGVLGFSTGITYDITTNTTNPSGHVQLGVTDLTAGVISNFITKLPIRMADLGDLNA